MRMAANHQTLESKALARSQMKEESVRRAIEALETAVQERQLVVLRPDTAGIRLPGEIRIARRSTLKA